MNVEVIMAGFGGQGIMLIGQLLTHAGMIAGKHVSWLPSYGPEMRGGTANCTVVVSDEEVASPIITRPSELLVMNLPSFDKFVPTLRPNGVLVYNTSLIDRDTDRKDIRVIKVPANEIAEELGNKRVANMVMLGALIEATKVLSMDDLKAALEETIPAHHHDLIPLNLEALKRGAALAKN
jgi:2-oxoglutarate ferredoxin oxidoreductase subunit gamma